MNGQEWKRLEVNSCIYFIYENVTRKNGMCKVTAMSLQGQCKVNVAMCLVNMLSMFVLATGWQEELYVYDL